MPYPYMTLLKIGPLTLFTFGFFMLVGFLLALHVALRRAKGRIAEDHIYNVAIISLLAGLVGSRIAFILFNSSLFTSFWEYFAIWEGGMSFFGGFILALLSIFVYTKKKRISFPQVLDIFAPGLALAIAITRIGGFLAGANPGLETNVAWAFQGTHPVAIYHSLANFIVFFVLIKIDKSKLGEKFRAGYLFAFFMLLFGLERFVNDFFRAYDTQATILAARIAPLVLAALALFLLTKLRKS
ncbi:MAG TPA: prolipoprotein diacylglyceryl transferase [Nanoarchaeota archaeon]|nr:prolipoprotein diacylglyceryl transferase [Nanoarchaeota archaeon]